MRAAAVTLLVLALAFAPAQASLRRALTAPAPAKAKANASPAAKPAVAAAPPKANGPTKQAEKLYFIFGYGSLLNWASTVRSNCGLTGLSEDNIAALEKLLDIGGVDFNKVLNACTVKRPRAVRVKGLERGWYERITNAKSTPGNPFPGSAFNVMWTSLGAVEKPGAYSTGLVYEVTEQAYKNTVARESGYKLLPLRVSDIAVLSGAKIPKDAVVTAFVSYKSVTPAADAPVPLSYIDVWLGGAIDLQKQYNLTGDAYAKGSPGGYKSFVEETLKTTSAWTRYIINDRDQALRPFGETRNVAQIDDSLYKFVDHKNLAGMRFLGQPW
ncbi:hypothetical protein MNEG_9574 [Monoraphidium neglectum]|uniref:Gamma-glutamylcyclotransferase n=1 Tax=Monoraphidium neglectum TaxID=145388 RepID=A0A0D2M492_9CHLO|nr:hypothetical protein MNEG_9574 [Monoraphidium neglectum]KIY98389.1 hypothetical protein MNEG_9574 [Monoraphidium neglectum]|eukprot:XP_013897409.1 hypothetical protein MNEG_9574 [Monoraphidium neglectum]